MKRTYILTAFFFSVVLIACNSTEQKSNEGATIIESEVISDESEMTLLMRDMFVNYATVKDSIVAGKSIDRALFNEIHRIHRAEPTDSTIMGPVFEGLADNYLNTVDTFLLAEKNKEMYFNISVQACVDCHKEFCPGPIDKIKGLLIKPKQEQN